MQWRDDTTRWRHSTTLPSRASATATCSMSALAHFADSSRTSPEVREWDGPAALPPPTTLRVRGGLSGEGAPHASRIHGSRSDHHWDRYGQEHTSHDRSRFAPSCCERRSRADASHRGSRTCHPASLASKQEWQHTMLLVSLPRLVTM